MNITKTEKRRLIYRGVQEGEVVIEEALSYTPIGGSRRKWDTNIVGMTPDEFKKIVELAKRDLGDNW